MMDETHDHRMTLNLVPTCVTVKAVCEGFVFGLQRSALCRRHSVLALSSTEIPPHVWLSAIAIFCIICFSWGFGVHHWWKELLHLTRGAQSARIVRLGGNHGRSVLVRFCNNNGSPF